MLLERLGIAVYRFPKGGKTAAVLQRETDLRAWIKQGWSYRKIAKECGVHPWTVQTACKQLGIKARPFTPDKWQQRKNELLGYLRKGMKRGEIAKKLGVTRNAIVGACHRLNLGADPIVQEQTREAVRQQMRALSARASAKLAANGGRRKPTAKRQTNRKGNGGEITMTDNQSWRFHMRAKAPPPDSATRCTIDDIRMGRCRYIVDEIGGTFYCGAPAETDIGSWCPYHANFVFVRTSGDVGGSPAAASRTGVESSGSSVGPAARPHLIPEAA